MSLAPAARGLQRERERLIESWQKLARPNQLAPDGDWLAWLILAGRGWGKTRSAAEWIKDRALKRNDGRYALVAATYADARDTMVEGESGLLAILQPHELRGGSEDTAWNRSLGELYLANGSKFKIYSSEKPRQLRGPQNHDAWCDELSSWADADKGIQNDTTWSNLLFGLRLGEDPRVVIATTPKPHRLVRELMAQENVIMTQGSTYENLDNLSPTFRKNVVELYEGTRLGRQELEGELLEDTPGALWQFAMFNREGFRLTEWPTLERIVIGVDPAASSSEGSAETGIIVAGKGRDGRAYVLADASLRGSPNEWANAAVEAYRHHKADRIVAERNNGGEMVESTIRTVSPNVPVKTVWASRGKQTRAEPVAALYEQGKVSHIGPMPALESQLTSWVPDMDSPDRLDALVWALTELMLGDEQQTTASDSMATMAVMARMKSRRVGA